jgi:RimJ/RimL family protein N-acetyltransferase
MIAAFVDQLFQEPAVTRIQVAPRPDNARAIRCYGKVGFQPLGPIQTPDGEAPLMSLARAEWIRGGPMRPH